MIVSGKMNFINENITYHLGDIFEYDMKHAYPSILKGTNFVFKDPNLRKDIENLNNYHNKKEMLIRIGKEFRNNPSITTYINNEIIKTIEQFQLDNNLDEENVITIKKDALFVTKKCNKLKFGNIEFSVKNKYNLFFYDKFKKHEYFIYKKLNDFKYDIKGIKNENIDPCVYDNISKLIYFSLTSMDLSKVKYIQEIFMNEDEKAFDYIPLEIPYKELIYINKYKLKEDNKLGKINYKEYYFEYYSTVCKILINLLLY